MSPTVFSSHTYTTENHGTAIIEVLCGNSTDSNLEENWQCLIPAHCLRTIQDVKKDEKIRDHANLRVSNSRKCCCPSSRRFS